MDEHEILSGVLTKVIDPSYLANDAFVFEDFVVTKDLLVEGVHFFPFVEPYKLAKKALRVNLSDLAAMGAEPVGYFLGLVLGEAHKNAEWLGKFTDGLLDDNRSYNVKLFGGDTTIHSGSLVVSITMIGKKGNRTLSRSDARPGDRVCVSGPIGDAYLGLLSYKGELDANSYFRLKYDLPEPRVDMGKDILSFATSCIDISDGLLSEAQHLAKNSGVTVTIFADDVPISREAQALFRDKPGMKKDIFTAGDDYELLFTIPEGHHAIHNYSVIGFVSKGQGNVKVLDSSGKELHFDCLGFSHQ